MYKKKCILFISKSLLFFCFFLCFQELYGIDEWSSTDVRSFSLGNIHTLSDELLNPASISFAERAQGGISVLNRFQMKELTTANLYLKYPNKWLDAGFKLSVSGYEDYRMIRSQFSFSKKILSGFSLGVHLLYSNESSILEDDSPSSLASSLGAYCLVNEQITLAFVGENLLRTSKRDDRSLYVGVKYKPFGSSQFFFETGYANDLPFRFAVGFEYAVEEKFLIRAGFDSHSQVPSLGVAYNWAKGRVETGFSWHSTLGISSMIGLTFEW
ncbi:MAG: hypothetical protein FWF52_02305 [Candidatus Azobacteroides sp.]|nr:hypothetical protein [Candidatus Azobacteroides sp.]